MKSYQLKPFLLLWLIPIVPALFLAWVTSTLNEIEPVIASSAGAFAFLASSIIGILSAGIDINKHWKGMVWHDKHMMIRTEGLNNCDIIYVNALIKNIKALSKSPHRFVIDKLTACKTEPNIYITEEEERKINFLTVTIKPKGKITYTIGKKTFKAKGLHIGNLSMIECLQPETMLSLIYHEYAHHVLTAMGLDRHEPIQHEIMKEAGIS